MKKLLIAVCAAAAFVGCDQNRGGMGDDVNTTTGTDREMRPPPIRETPDSPGSIRSQPGALTNGQPGQVQPATPGATEPGARQ